MPSEIRRKFKNTIKNYTDAQVKVREATSNDPWGPSSTVMGEIADLTYNVVAFSEIMQMIWKRVNDHGKNWRHVYKSLVLLEYIIKTGSERVAQQCKENIFAIQTLKDFQHSEDNKDQGVNVREKAKSLVSLLKDDERLKNERAKALKARERFAQNSTGIGSHTTQAPFKTSGGSPRGLLSDQRSHTDATHVPGSKSEDSKLSEIASALPSSHGEEELQLQLALAISKEQHDEDLRNQRNDDVRLQMAMQESIKEDDAIKQRLLQGRTYKHRHGLVDLLDTNAAAAPKPVPTDPWGLPAPPSSHHHPHQHVPAPTQQQTDPWGMPVEKVAPPVSDPWGASAAPAPVNNVPVVREDPWGAPPAAALVPPAVVNDPWGGQPSSDNSSQQNSPWGTPAKAPEPSPGAGLDIFNSSHTEPTPTIDNEFDMLSSRPIGSSTTTITTGNGDLTGGSFDLNNIGQSLPYDDKKSKSPQDFLGVNSGLVNLDNLVTRSTETTTTIDSTNPFAVGVPAAPAPVPIGTGLGDRMPTGYNPFAGPSIQPMSLSQMSNPGAMNFQQTNTGLVLPAPMAPSGFQTMQPIGGGHSNNPFL